MKSGLPSREFPLGSPISYLSCDCDKVSDQRKAGKKGLFSCAVDGGKVDIARRTALAEVGGCEAAGCREATIRKPREGW